MIEIQKNEFGSPDILSTIFQKINHSKFFICDVSLNDNHVPNANVLIELGYAIKVLGWSKIICLFNAKRGKIEELPFDINHNRVTSYNPDGIDEKNMLSEIIYCNINELFKRGQLYNPIEDHLKKKIDYIFLQITKNIINIFDFEKEVNLSKRLLELDNLSIERMAYLLAQKETLGFYYLFYYEDAQLKLEKLLDQLLSCDYFADSCRESVINLIDWIDIWNHTIDPHFSPKLFKKTVDSSYEIKDMYAGNSNNPPNSVILMKKRNGNEYSVAKEVH